MLHEQAIDTGTTLIYVPDEIAAQFYDIVNPMSVPRFDSLLTSD